MENNSNSVDESTISNSFENSTKEELIAYINKNSYEWYDGFASECEHRAVNIGANECKLSSKAYDILFDEELNEEFWIDEAEVRKDAQEQVDRQLGYGISSDGVVLHNVEIVITGRGGKNLCLFQSDNNRMFQDLEKKSRYQLQQLAYAVEILCYHRQFMIDYLEDLASKYDIKAEEYTYTAMHNVLVPIVKETN